MTKIKLRLGDCLNLMDELEDSSVDMVLCDLPYGTTQCAWDTEIDLTKLWSEYLRVCKPNAAIVLFAQSPFDKKLAMSAIQYFKYEWVWEKTTATGFLNAKKAPLKAHENILVFYRSLPVYNPQMLTGQSPVHSYTKRTGDGDCYGKTKAVSGGGSTSRYPRDVVRFSTDKQKLSLHPTQKPVKLCKYLIKTYTDKGAVVLDNCFGSGSTAIACLLTGRSFIGMELNSGYFRVAVTRVQNMLNKLRRLKKQKSRLMKSRLFETN